MEKAKEIILSTYLFRGVSEALEGITLNEIKTFNNKGKELDLIEWEKQS